MECMRTLPLGKNGPQVPVICFGTFPIGGGFGAIPESQAVATVHAALDAGLTFIDTAEGYSNAEELLGKALGRRRQEVFLATKLSRNNHSPDQIDDALERSLNNLQTDYVDLYQIHSPSNTYPTDQTLDRFMYHRDAGRIRYIGVSNFTADQTKNASRDVILHSSQPRYNLFFRDVEAEVLPACERKGIGVIAHSVLAKGLLGGKYLPGHEFEQDDQRHDWEFYRGTVFERIYETAARLDGWARDQGRDLAQLALAWPVAHPAVTSSIVGMRTVRQGEMNVSAADWELTKLELAEIEQVLGDLRLHFYHGPNREYYGFRDEGDPEYIGPDRSMLD